MFSKQRTGEEFIEPQAPNYKLTSPSNVKMPARTLVTKHHELQKYLLYYARERERPEQSTFSIPTVASVPLDVKKNAKKKESTETPTLHLRVLFVCG